MPDAHEMSAVILPKVPKKRYPSQMNLSELKNECINRGIAPREMTKMQIRKAMEKHDNRINTDK
jgi:hypothetical protein